MGSGLIYAAIVAAWAVILVPRWLARHDERAPVIIERSPEEVAQAVEDRAASTGRVLDRGARAQPRNPRPLGYRTRRRHPHQAAGVRPPGMGARRDPAGRARSGRPASSPASARSSVHVRRRRVLALLALLAASSVALGLAGGPAQVPMWVVGLALAVLIGYVSRLRIEVKRARRRDRRRQLLARQAAARRHAVRAARRRAPARRPAETPGRPVLVNPDGTWNPIPLPLPTYITAPVVDRPAARVIDVGATGAAWTSGGFRSEPIQPEPAPAETAASELAGPSADDQDVSLDQPAAVNG
ncbi:MAG TPA: hypothetical protein VKG85_04940 [Actinomycetes bacterium]|nr:hypothetical protein [Actinomycetes bacterium]